MYITIIANTSFPVTFMCSSLLLHAAWQAGHCDISQERLCTVLSIITIIAKTSSAFFDLFSKQETAREYKKAHTKAEHILSRNVYVQFSLITIIANTSCPGTFMYITIIAYPSFPVTFMYSSLL